MLNLLALLVAASCLVALANWRWGVFAAIAVSFLQDPLRKVIPGAPAYLVLGAAPIWLCVLLAAARVRQLPVRRFLDRFPRLGWWARIFAAYLVIPAAISATYGRNSWMITLLGAFVYAVMFLMLVAGWRFPARKIGSAQLLAFYAVAASLMLLVGPLEALGYQAGNPFLGTEALGHVWVTHRTGEAVYMHTGFFRSPDIMGWHAALTFMAAVILAFRAKGVSRWFWMAVAVMAVLDVWLCGRRKMFSMILVFLGCYSLFVFRFSRVQKILSAAGTALMVVGLGWYLISSMVYDEAVERFYLPTFTEAGSPDFSVNGWYALYAPAKTPKPIVEKLSATLQKVLKQPEVIEKLRGVGVSPASGIASEAEKYGLEEFAKYTKLIKDANVKAD